MATVTKENPAFVQLRAKGEEWLRLYGEAEKLKAAAKGLEARAEAVEKEMVETLQEIQEKVVHLDQVGRFQLDPQLFVNVKVGDKPAVVEWLKNDPDGAALVQEDVNASRLKSFVKERLLQGKPVHELIKATPVTQIKFVPAKG